MNVQVLDNETSHMLELKLSVNSDNSMTALQIAINNSLTDEQLDLPLDVMVLETQALLDTVRGIEKSLFYNRDL